MKTRDALTRPFVRPAAALERGDSSSPSCPRDSSRRPNGENSPGTKSGAKSPHSK